MKITLKCASLDFTFSNHGLSLYPKFHDESGDDRIGFLKSLFEIKADSTLGCLYQVEDADGMHPLFHQDELNPDLPHYHLRFRSLLSEKQLTSILTIFENNSLISTEDKVIFLQQLDELYQDEKISFDLSLDNERKQDLRTITNWIKNCFDNEKLICLHHHLLDGKFDYLKHTKKTGFWQGSNDEGKLVNTSRSWAMIEKAISLQLAKNTTGKCMDERWGFHYVKAAKEMGKLDDFLPFFMARRKPKGDSFFNMNKSIRAFCTNEDKFEESYSKHFDQFKI